MEKIKHELIINHGDTFERRVLDKKDFLWETSRLLREPKQIFMGLGNFLELGDYNNLLDSLLFSEKSMKLEKVLDKNNRRMSQKGNIPFSFFKLGVYIPDFLLKDVPTSFVSTIAKKSRLAPGAKNFVKYIKDYNPLVLSAIPYGFAIELVRRIGLDKENLVSTDYKVKKDKSGRYFYAGGLNRFISGDRKSIEIERVMIDNDLTDDDVVYIGSGEAGTKTFTRVKHSVAFNPSLNIMPVSEINIYGSSLESLLVLFNFDGSLDKFLSSTRMEEYLPTLVVYSKCREKSDELLEIEKHHRNWQNGVMAQRVEHSESSYDSVVNEIDIDLKGSTIDIDAIREMISERIKTYYENPQNIVKKIYNIALERYKSLGL